MKITGAALINRFYCRDGWTRELVAELLLEPIEWEDKLKCVTLRYVREKQVIRPPINFGDGIPLDEDSEPYYYAVYTRTAIFNKQKVEEHRYSPFASSLGRVWDCDKNFGRKNRWK